MPKTLRRLGGLLFDQPYLLLSLTSLFWAGNVVLGRYIAGDIPPVTLAWVRWTGAGLLLLPFAWRHLKADWPVIRSHSAILTVLSFTGITLYNTMAYVGLQYTQALNALLLQSTVPMMIAVISFTLFRDRLTGRQMAGIAASLTGVLLIICRGDLTILLGIQLNKGDIWMLSALAIYALYTALLRLRPKMHWLSFVALTVIWGNILLTPAFIWEVAQGARPVWTPATIAVFAYVIVFPSVLAYIFFNRGVDLIGANRSGPFFHLMPVFGSALAILFLGERPQWYHAAGYLLVISGILIATRKARAVMSSSDPRP